MSKRVVIIGNGIAGITAARHIRKNSDNEITVISGETEYFFSRTALMYIYMGQMRLKDTQPYEEKFWKKNRIQLKKAWVKKVDFKTREIYFETGDKCSYDVLILATGSKSNKFDWKGQDSKGVQGLYSLQDLELMQDFTRNQNVREALIVGGGLIGIEMAEMLAYQNIQSTFLIRDAHYWGNTLSAQEGALVQRLLDQHGVKVHYQSELEAIIPDKKGQVCAVRTKSNEELHCQFVGLTVGVSPNISFLKNSGLEYNKGILVDEYLATNIPDVYAIGDCAELRNPPPGRKSIEAVWYVGRIMGETVAQTICEQKLRYQPGPWFNSAKFFEVEYQTYGQIPAELPEEMQSFIWENEQGNKLFRMVFSAKDEKLLGLSTFGIRVRHHLMDQWLKEGVKARVVLENLRNLNFDPEFYKDYASEIVEQFNRRFHQNIQVQKRSWLKALFHKSSPKKEK